MQDVKNKETNLHFKSSFFIFTCGTGRNFHLQSIARGSMELLSETNIKLLDNVEMSYDFLLNLGCLAYQLYCDELKIKMKQATTKVLKTKVGTREFTVLSENQVLCKTWEVF